MTIRKNILILTSGGLAPALNATLYGAIATARSFGYKIYGGLNGWVSLVQNGKITNLTALDIEVIKNRGGNMLRSSRTNPLKVENGLIKMREKIKKYSLDGIIVIGGDDTLGAAAKLYQEEKIPIVGLPKTVDNDLPKNYFSPGFPTAAFNAAKLTAETKEDSAYNLSRVYIIEMYGADAGWLTAAAALGGADIVIPPEWQFNLNDILKLTKQKYEANGNYCVIALAKEGRIKGLRGLVDTQPDGFSNVRQEFISLQLKQAIEGRLGLNAKIIIPMNVVQSGRPIALDQKIGLALGKKGAELIKHNHFGQAAIIKYAKSKFTVSSCPLTDFLKPKKLLNESYFNKHKMLPTQKYFAYLKTLLGKREFIDLIYQKLQKKLNK